METEKILQYIRETANDEPRDLIPVNGGLSEAEKYKVTLSGCEWMVKITSGDSKRDTWYRKLGKYSTDQMANPKMHRLFIDGNLCLLSTWITGENLEEKLKIATPSQLTDYGIQAASILLHLHKETLEYPQYSKSLTNRIISACNQIDELKLTFPGYKECLAFLIDAAKYHKAEQIGFLHQDIRPENFIVHGDKLILIDFENGSLGERAADFSYLTTMGKSEHHAFSRILIDTYLQNVDDQTFWRDNLLYSTLQVVEYAIWKWKTKGKQTYFQAENLMQQYDAFKSVQPYWWKNI